MTSNSNGHNDDDVKDRDAVSYFNRSYKAVDGLWFMKVEEKFGFDVALELDSEVWKIVPKIQARTMKSILAHDHDELGIDELFYCLTARMKLEGFEFSTDRDEFGFKLRITRCPWHDIMVNAGRLELNEAVGEVICATEMDVWAKEFSPDIGFKRRLRICKGSPYCIIEFSKPSQTTNGR